MALIKCPDCGKEVSDAASACPNCSRPISPTTTPPPKAKASGCSTILILIAVGGMLVLGFCAAIIGSSANRAAEAVRTAQNAAPSAAKPGPPPAQAPGLRRDPEIDVKIDACKQGGFGAVALWDLTLTNKSDKWSFADLQYRANYEAESGARLRTSRGTLTIVLKPKEVRKLRDFNDGFWPQQAERCSFTIYGAEAR